MKNDILYSFRRCPYAIRARWALLICEIKVEIREIDLKNKPLDFLNNSKTKTVPILIKKNSEVIEESLEIILWALSKSKKENIKLTGPILHELHMDIFEMNIKYSFSYCKNF